MNRRIAWVLILIVDVLFLAWGAMAAAFPDHLLGPGGQPILRAGYEGFTGGSWSELVRTAPMTADYISVLFRLYSVFCVIFGVMAIAITVTAFRRGDGWAWWALLVGNTMALVAAMRARTPQNRNRRVALIATDRFINRPAPANAVSRPSL